MHHFIYPSQDTYISNRTGLTNLNFGVDELLQVGTINTIVGVISDTREYVYVDQIFYQNSVTDFTGTFTGSVMPGTASFTGSLVGVTACLTGTGSGVDVRNERTRTYVNSQSIDRALVKFDLTAISNSIASGLITNPSFHLKVKICNEYELPIDYSVYAFPISQSWEMGNGYASDGGSDEGASWLYRDFDDGTPWSASGGTYYQYPCTQSFRYKSADIDMDVSSIVNLWIAGTIPNEGFLIISSDEVHPTGSGYWLKYFSQDTNTIYSPYLDVGWADDYTFVTGSITTSSVQITTVTGSSLTVQSESSSLYTVGGIHGNFTASAFLTTPPHYVTASSVVFDGVLVQRFTGSLTGSFYGVITDSLGTFSGSGAFSASYFTGSIDGVNTETSGSVSGSSIDGTVSSSIIMPSTMGSFLGTLQSPAILLMGTASGYYYDELYSAFGGFIWGSGFTGNIMGVPVMGLSEGLITQGTTTVTLPTEFTYRRQTSPLESPYVGGVCPTCLNIYSPIDMEYVWGGSQVGWTSTISVPSGSVITSSCGKTHTVQIMSGSFTSGVFSGSTFLAYYENYKIIFASLTGSWNSNALSGAHIVIHLPSEMYPYVMATVYGPFVNGTALGLYTLDGPGSASFFGQMVDGILIGSNLALQLTGSTFTSSFSYTSSVSLTSSVLYPMDANRPFSINIQNLQPQYKSGDIIKIGVFGRKKFPLKDFGILTQQAQYLVPEYLPVSSSYALKDNQTDEIVLNFDSYTRISCEYPGGNYFYVDTTGLPQERYYRVLIRVEDGPVINTVDTGKIFKITR